MGQDSHWLQDIENISPAHHWYRSYGCWCSRPRVRPWSWTRLLLVKREIWTWNCCCVRVCVLFFSSSHLSLKETPTKHFTNAIRSEKAQPLARDSARFPFGRCFNGPLCLKTCISTRWRWCGGVRIVTFRTTSFLFLTLWVFFLFFLPSPTPRIP